MDAGWRLNKEEIRLIKNVLTSSLESQDSIYILTVLFYVHSHHCSTRPVFIRHRALFGIIHCTLVRSTFGRCIERIELSTPHQKQKTPFH